MKFGNEVVLRGGKVLGGGVRLVTPHPQGTGWIKGVRGAYGASATCFGKKIKKQKLQCIPDLVGAGHLF